MCYSTSQDNRALKIALDYDETFTANRELFTNFVYLAKAMKCEVVFVTYRYNNGLNADIYEDAKFLDIPIIYTGGEPKELYYKADVWIDDSPETIIDLNEY